MAAIAAFTAAAKSAWTHLAERAGTADATADLGPNQRKEAGLAPGTASWVR